MKGVLVLENGRRFPGLLAGGEGMKAGEVVFHTGMTGYQEILTDPSYAGQIVVMTYPLIGNYGLNAQDAEAKRPWLAGFVTGEACSLPNHYLQEKTLHEYLAHHEVPLLTDVDTRALVRVIREHGSLKGYIVPVEAATEEPDFSALPRDLVKKVSTPISYSFSAEGEYHVVLLDFGAKENIARSLTTAGCRVTVMPATSTAEQVRAMRPDGIMLSNGPGDPLDCADLLPTVKELAEEFPTFGICLGHQLLALAFGARTEKMRFGHRGSNHPVRDLQSDKIWITSQNHGYTVADAGLPDDLIVTHRNVNDGSVEGLKHRDLAVFSVQFHPEACPGPQDAQVLFEDFLSLMKERKGQHLVTTTV
ncbi:carbamoyl phosphate synthase small subunit [Tumebacillus sp. DT12]|uniref:Carbamoyl phosphate synthase small chain n=1 Tax=Tumebacillus lacus TaxID=2995335 RepID=A0ABT3X544_9BACL|nr:carbamoyl phosphate synthase small subunit [Tumebacillus lacus]MCX7571088.1 carbamoyl phosphate synthase small subunit [Tumebacillus lacus]